jgi:LysM repeat protein
VSAIRQAASGLIYAVLSIVLVLGSLSVALAERNASAPPAATSTASPVTPETDTPVPTEQPGGETTSPSEISGVAPAATTAVTQAVTAVVPSSTPGVSYPTVAPARRAPTATRAASTPCGPPPGWIRAYVVQPGDSMFHIATLYRTTVSTLQRANCKTSYLIFAGERLWVPNVPAATPGVTIIPPFFDTPTEEPTYAITETPLYFTATAAPADTATPGP